MRQIQEFDNPNRVAPGTTPLPKAIRVRARWGRYQRSHATGCLSKPDLTRVPVTGGEEEEAIPARQYQSCRRAPVTAITCCPKPSNLIQIR